MAFKWGIIIGGVFIVSILACLVTHVTLMLGFLVSLLIALSLLKRQGIAYKTSLSWLKEGILSIKEIYIVILMIGVNVAMWIDSGIVPSMIYYGFSIIDKVNFLLFAYLMSALVALFMGTGLGTLSTVGVAIFTLGTSIGIEPAVLLGAVLSGAYVADRLSPISALVNFTLENNQTSFKDYATKTLIVMFPAMLISGIVYYFMGQAITQHLYIWGVEALKINVSSAFRVNPVMMFIPVLVLIYALSGAKSSHTLGLGIFLGSFVALVIQRHSVLHIVTAYWSGYHSDSNLQILKSLEIGGLSSMIEVVVIVMGGISISTIFEKCGWVKPMKEKIIGTPKSYASLVARTSVFSIMLNALTCDQTVGIVIPSRHLQTDFEKFDKHQSSIAQIIANSGTALAPLMPWNVNAIIILGITGISAIKFAPYMILNWSTLLIYLAILNLMKWRSQVKNVKNKPTN